MVRQIGHGLDRRSSGDPRIIGRGLSRPGGVVIPAGWSVAATQTDLGFTNNNLLGGIVWGQGRFVSVGRRVAGSGPIGATSTDGLTWGTISVPPSYAGQIFNAIAYDGVGTFCAVGDAGAVMTSPDGLNWTLRTASAASNWNGVAFGAGVFAAVSDTGATRCMTSPDGITWTNRTITSSSWQDVVFGGGQFVAVNDNFAGTLNASTSPDGITWTDQTTPTKFYAGVNYDGVALYAVVGNDIMTSPDGVTWTDRAIPQVSSWMDLAFGNSRWAAVSFDGVNRAMASLDGLSWALSNPAPPVGNWGDVAFAPGLHGVGLFAAISIGATANQIMISQDAGT